MARIASTSVRRLWLIGFLLLLTAVAVTVVRHTMSSELHVGGLTVATQALAFEGPGTINETAASASAQQKLHDLRPEVTGLVLSKGRELTGVTRIDNATGQTLYTNTTGVNAWVFEITGPAQQGFAKTTGYAVVDAHTGDVKALSILQAR